jgi:hypothetical protein
MPKFEVLKPLDDLEPGTIVDREDNTTTAYFVAEQVLKPVTDAEAAKKTKETPKEASS